MDTLIAIAVADKNQISIWLDDDLVRIQYNDENSVGLFPMSRKKFLSRLNKICTHLVPIRGFTMRMIVEDEFVHFNVRTVDEFSPSLVMQKAVLHTLIRAM